MRSSSLSLALLSVVIVLSCSKDNSDIKDYASPYYYEATIDGKRYKEPRSKTSDYYVSRYQNSEGDHKYYFGAGIQPGTTLGNTALVIFKGVIDYWIEDPTDAEFKAFFKPGNYPYAKNSKEGIEIIWMDEKEEDWSTSYGSADQTGSNFKIISTVDDNFPAGNYVVRVTMEFNCKLYNEAGQSKKLTSGKMVGLFEKY